MSRIGKQPIVLPPGVQVRINNNVVEVQGPKGKISQKIHPDMIVEVQDNVVRVQRPSDSKKHRQLHGLTRSLVANAVQGVYKEFEKRLELVGVGYNAKLKGKNLELQIGFCHPFVLPIPDGVTAELPTNTKIILKSVDKYLVGQFAANIRRVRPPEPYKGKGIKYEGEVIQRKAGKSFVGGE